MKTILYCLILATVFASCDKLPLQDSFDYKPAPKNNRVNMTAWEYIQTNPEIFSNFEILVTEVFDPAYYSQRENKYTYLLLNNAGVTELLNKYGVTIATLNQLTPEQKESLCNRLRYHIVNGYYHGVGTLSFEPVFVITLWKDPQAFMTMRVQKTIDYKTHSRVQVNYMAGSSTARTPVLSNILANNGAIHIFANVLEYRP